VKHRTDMEGRIKLQSNTKVLRSYGAVRRDIDTLLAEISGELCNHAKLAAKHPTRFMIDELNDVRRGLQSALEFLIVG